jgi:hypothetical protein
VEGLVEFPISYYPDRGKLLGKILVWITHTVSRSNPTRIIWVNTIDLNEHPSIGIGDRNLPLLIYFLKFKDAA